MFADEGAIRIRGDAGALHLDARGAAVADVLAALSGTFDVSYSSRIALTQDIYGSYSGSLRRVLARVLNSYDYVIKQDHAKLNIIIIGAHGAQAVPAAASVAPADPFHPLRARQRQRLGVDRHRAP